MEEFKSIEAVSELFAKVNCIGERNMFFISYNDITSGNPFLLGGAVGGALGAMKSLKENRGVAYLVNQTEKGIGLIPLTKKGEGSGSPKNLQVNPEAFTFIEQHDIKKIKIKRANLISAVTKKVVIEEIGGRKYKWLVNNKEKLLPYHESNFVEFKNMYKK